MQLFEVVRTDLVEAREPRRVHVRAWSEDRALALAAERSEWFRVDGANTDVRPVECEGAEGVLIEEVARRSDKPYAVHVLRDGQEMADTLHGRYATSEEATEALMGVVADVRAGRLDATAWTAYSEGRGSWGLGPVMDGRTFRLDVERADGETESSLHEGLAEARDVLRQEIGKNDRHDRIAPDKAVVYAEIFKVVPGTADEPWPGKFVRDMLHPRVVSA